MRNHLGNHRIPMQHHRTHRVPFSILNVQNSSLQFPFKILNKALSIDPKWRHGSIGV